MKDKKEDFDLEKVKGGLDFDLNHEVKAPELSSEIVCQHKFDNFNCGGCPSCKIVVNPGSNIDTYSCEKGYYSGLLFDKNTGKIIS